MSEANTRGGGRGKMRLKSDRLLRHGEDTRRKTKKGLGDGKDGWKGEKGNGELIDTTCSWSTRTGRPD